MNDDSIATHMYCHVLSVLLTGPKKKKKKRNSVQPSVSSLHSPLIPPRNVVQDPELCVH